MTRKLVLSWALFWAALAIAPVCAATLSAAVAHAAYASLRAPAQHEPACESSCWVAPSHPNVFDAQAQLARDPRPQFAPAALLQAPSRRSAAAILPSSHSPHTSAAAPLYLSTRRLRI